VQYSLKQDHVPLECGLLLCVYNVKKFAYVSYGLVAGKQVTLIQEFDTKY
jgi:hypothetical protein